jgi:spore coat polysaccharide biosynthesis protein SpsF
MGSVRLPGKVLLDVAGSPMLTCVVNRVRRAKMLDAVVVATSTLPADDSIEALCAEQRWDYFRGSEDDVLDRYYRAAVDYQAGAVVRVTSDCPLIDPLLIDGVVQTFLDSQPNGQYASNVFPVRTFPRGLDTEIIRFDVLEWVWRSDQNPAWREHVTSYVHRHPERFDIRSVTSTVDYSHLRWTVDTPQDLELVRLIYNHFGSDSFAWQEVLPLLEQHPEWLAINRNIQQKTVA